MAGVTVHRAAATFRDCVFEDNATLEPLTGGGGVGIAIDSTALFERSTWTGNSSMAFGGALTVEEHASAVVRDSTFTGNSVAGPGHHPTSAGGAVHVGNSTLVVERSRFQDNVAGYVAGALYAIGTYGDAAGGSSVRIENSTFVHNRAERHPSVSFDSPTEGGAVHAENLTSMQVIDSRFFENQAQHGGGLNAYRATVEVRDSVFRGNHAVGGPSFHGVGGQISVISNDGVDESTGGGVHNRPPASLLVEDSLLEGRYGATGVAGNVGGCLFAQGDSYRAFGLLGTPQAGSLAENRASVTLRRLVFSDCDVEQSTLQGSGYGGALMVDVADLRLEDSLVVDSDAVGRSGMEQAGGGGLAVLSHSHAVVERTVFVANSAATYGGGVFAQGADLEVSDSVFLRNELSPGVTEACTISYGAAIFSAPHDAIGPDPDRPDQPATGFVADSLLGDNVGVAIFDDDRSDGPINDMRYHGNQVFAAVANGQVYSNPVPNFVPPFSWCISAAQMSALVVQRAGAGSTVKSLVPNVDLTQRPPLAALQLAPSRPLAAHAAGDPAPAPGVPVGFAWSGAMATLNGVEEPDGQGVFEAPPGPVALMVDDGLARATAVVVPEAGAGVGTLASFAVLAALGARRRISAPRPRSGRRGGRSRCGRRAAGPSDRGTSAR